jgi:hypothetical protein
LLYEIQLCLASILHSYSVNKWTEVVSCFAFFILFFLMFFFSCQFLKERQYIGFWLVVFLLFFFCFVFFFNCMSMFWEIRQHFNIFSCVCVCMCVCFIIKVLLL